MNISDNLRLEKKDWGSTKLRFSQVCNLQACKLYWTGPGPWHHFHSKAESVELIRRVSPPKSSISSILDWRENTKVVTISIPTPALSLSLSLSLSLVKSCSTSNCDQIISGPQGSFRNFMFMLRLGRLVAMGKELEYSTVQCSTGVLDDYVT